MDTRKRSEKKSMRSSTSSPKREVHLQWRPDFWDFWTENREDVDYIINSNIHAAQHSPDTGYAFRKNLVSPEDLYQEILVKLHKSDFLRVFDEKKSELHSYLTNRVHGYLHHVISGTDRPYKYFAADKDSRAIRLQPEEGFNVNVMDSLPGSDEADSLAIRNEIIRKIKQRTPKKYHKILDGCINEVKFRDIARKARISEQYVGIICKDISNVARKLLNKPPRKISHRKRKKTSLTS